MYKCVVPYIYEVLYIPYVYWYEMYVLVNIGVSGAVFRRAHTRETLKHALAIGWLTFAMALALEQSTWTWNFSIFFLSICRYLYTTSLRHKSLPTNIYGIYRYTIWCFYRKTEGFVKSITDARPYNKAESTFPEPCCVFSLVLHMGIGECSYIVGSINKVYITCV